MLFTCLGIFLARILDVSISTFKTMLMVKKRSLIIPILAFLEVFIWFIAARKALVTDVDSILIPICYSLGYAFGTYIGGLLSRKFIKGISSIEIITKKNNYKLIDTLRDKGYGLSIIALKDTYKEEKDLIIMDIKSNSTSKTIKLIKKIDKKAFIVIKDTNMVYNGYIK